MKDIVRKEKINGYTIKIIRDPEPQNPRREWDNLGTMLCFHSRYDLGDKLPDYKSSNYNSWDEVKEDLEKLNLCAILPLYLYDHSGITMNTTGFSCRWDSGQVGFIFVTKETVREEYSVKRISPKLKQKVEDYLKGEVETYDEYLTGEVYGFELINPDGEEIDSCWGYFGDGGIEQIISECKTSIENRETKKSVT